MPKSPKAKRPKPLPKSLLMPASGLLPARSHSPIIDSMMQNIPKLVVKDCHCTMCEPRLARKDAHLVKQLIMDEVDRYPAKLTHQPCNIALSQEVWDRLLELVPPGTKDACGFIRNLATGQIWYLHHELWWSMVLVGTDVRVEPSTPNF